MVAGSTVFLCHANTTGLTHASLPSASVWGHMMFISLELTTCLSLEITVRTSHGNLNKKDCRERKKRPRGVQRRPLLRHSEFSKKRKSVVSLRKQLLRRLRELDKRQRLKLKE